MTNKGLVITNDKGNKKMSIKTWDDDSYEFLKTHVGGYIEHVYLPIFDNKGIDMWCNEEGKFDSSLYPTLALSCDGKIYDYVVGNLVFTRVNDDGDTISLNDDDVDYIKKVFSSNHKYAFIGDNIVNVFDYGREVV